MEFTTLDAVTEAEATAMAEKMCQAIFKTGLASAPPSPGAASASGGAQAAPAAAAAAAAAAPSAAIPSGLRPSSHQRRGIVLAGVTPDHPQYEMADVRENINGTDTVTGTARVLRQFTGDRHTLDFTDLPDRSGYQIATYRNADLGAPAANGIRPVPATARPVSVILFRNPDGQETTTQGRLDIIQKLRHPQTDEWVVTTIRQVFPVGGNTWTRDFYAGDLQQSPDLAPYRGVVFNRTRHANGTETFLATVSDRGNDGTMVVTSRVSRTYAYYKLGDPAILSETIDPGSPGALTTDWTYFTDAANPFAFNKPATMRRSDGSWANYGYQGSEVTGILITKTTTGIGDAPAPAIGADPNLATCRVVTEIEARNETGTFGREETVGGVLVSKSWGERHVDPAGFLVETRHRETGSGRLTTIRTGHPAGDLATGAERGRLKSIQHPDGTITLYQWAHEGENLVETTGHGSGTLSGITSGTRTRTVKSPHEETIAETVTDIASGVPLSSRVAVAMDYHQLPTKWVYDNDPTDYSEIQRGCCGIESERARDGTVTRYLRDALKRPVLVTTTTGARVVTRTYDYTASTAPETSGLPETTVTTIATGVGGGIVQSTVTDLHGRTVSETSPGPMGTPETTGYAYSADGLTTTQTNPDIGTVVTESYPDGQTKSVSGTATIAQSYIYGIHNENGGGEMNEVTTPVPHPSGQGVVERLARSYSDLAGRNFKTERTAPHGQLAVTTTTYNTLGQTETITSSGQPSVRYIYNPEGERVATWTDRNGDGQFNDATAPGLPDVKDSCATTQSDYLPAASAPAGLGDCQRVITTVRTEANEDKVLSATWQSVDGLRSRQETLGVAGASTATRTRPVDGASSSTQSSPDGTIVESATTILANGNAQTTTTSKDASSVILQTSTLVSDALGRTVQTTNGRGHVTNHAHYMHGGQTSSITQVNANPVGGNLVTQYTYTLSPGSGRLVTTTLPDGTMQYQESNFLGQTTRQWGSQTNPVKFTYDAAGRMATHTTFRAPVAPGNQQTIPSDGDTTTWVNDPSGVLREKVYADGNKTTYTYDIAGRLATRTWARGVVTTYGYTAGQLTSVDYTNDPTNTPAVSISYDRLGREVRRAGVPPAPDSIPIAETLYDYDPATLALDTETITIDPDGSGPLPGLTRILDRSRDLLSRDSGFELKTESLNTENSVTYGYDASGRMSTVTSPAGSFTYAYTPGSSLIASVTGPVHLVFCRRND